MISISATPPSQIADVLSLLLSHLSESEKLLQIHDLLEAAKNKELDLSGLIMATKQSTLCGAILSIVQPDQSAFVWPPVTLDDPESDEIENELLQFLGDQLDNNNVWMGQCITEVHDRRERQALQRNQFEHVANLIYMSRDLSAPIESSALTPDSSDKQDSTPMPESTTVQNSTPVQDPEVKAGLTTTSYTNLDSHERFKEILGKTYIGTYDCSALNHVRSLEKTLESHQLSGEFLPAQWNLYHNNNEDIGLLLMNDHPHQDAWEVVYTGVISESRGKGYGRKIIKSGLIDAKNAGRSQVFLAVDSKNHYAYSVYESLGFKETTQKSVHIRLNKG